MNNNTRIGIQILSAAVVIGLLGDLLLRVTPWGLNVLLFNLAFVGATAYLLRRWAPHLLNAQTIALMGAQLFFAAMFVWRDSIQLRVADSFAILACLSVIFLSQMKIVARFAGIVHYAIGFLWASFSSLIGPLLLVFSDVEWKEMPRDGWRKHAVAVTRGVAIAAPLVLIFGGLFVAADAAFEGLVRRVFNFDAEILISHIFIFSAFAWLSAGYLRGMLIQGIVTVPDAVLSVVDVPSSPEPTPSDESKMDRVASESGEYPVTLGEHTVVEHLNISDPPNKDVASEAETRPVGSVPSEADDQTKQKWSWPEIDNSILSPVFTLGSVEIGVILGVLNLLFISFVAVQVPYLFGGMDLVQNTPDFKLAEYARRGFGELVTVAALVLPLLLATHWLLRKGDRTAGILFKVLAGLQIVLLFVIMASAVQRLVLLTGNLGYGMTTVRLYPLIFMGWVAIVFIWFAVTVLRGHRQYFAWGALWSAFFVLAATHVLNPDEFIVKTNLALAREGRPFDAVYNTRELSDDALPALFNSIEQLSERDQQIIATRFADRYCEMKHERDLRSLNFSRQEAFGLIDSATEFTALIDCGRIYSKHYPHREPARMEEAH